MLLLGTNQGDMKKNLHRARRLLEEYGVHVKNQTKIYKTKPVGDTNQPDFLNQGLDGITELTPRQVLAAIKKIEIAMGRKKNIRRWGPRLIDIDILFYDRRQINLPHIQIPHSEFFNRPFAQIIAAELAPDFIPPGKKKICLNVHGE